MVIKDLIDIFKHVTVHKIVFLVFVSNSGFLFENVLVSLIKQWEEGFKIWNFFSWIFILNTKFISWLFMRRVVFKELVCESILPGCVILW